MAELIKLAKILVSCMKQITLTQSGAAGHYVD